MTPSNMKALKVVSKGVAQFQDAPTPEVKGDGILVKISHVALNPTDWKHIDKMPHEGATVGCDFAGTVEQVGPEVEGDWKTGDRIAGVVHGCNAFNLSDGAFAEYTLVREGTALKIPNSVSNADAATLGVGVLTTGMALYQKLALPWPGSIAAAVPILIYGGSTATGSLAIQFAKLSGATVLTMCSPRNFEFVKALGVTRVFNYQDADVVQQVREYTHDKLHYVMDCIGGEQAAQICSDVISPRGGQICSIAPTTKYGRDDVRKKIVLAYTATGRRVRIGDIDLPAVVEDYDFAKQSFRLGGKLLEEGKIKLHPARVSKGLEGVLEGLDEMRQGKVSGEKLVYTL